MYYLIELSHRLLLLLFNFSHVHLLFAQLDSSQGYERIYELQSGVLHKPCLMPIEHRSSVSNFWNVHFESHPLVGWYWYMGSS